MAYTAVWWRIPEEVLTELNISMVSIYFASDNKLCKFAPYLLISSLDSLHLGQPTSVVMFLITIHAYNYFNCPYGLFIMSLLPSK